MKSMKQKLYKLKQITNSNLEKHKNKKSNIEKCNLKPETRINYPKESMSPKKGFSGV